MLVNRLKLTVLFLAVAESLKFFHPHPRLMPCSDGVDVVVVMLSVSVKRR